MKIDGVYSNKGELAELSRAVFARRAEEVLEMVARLRTEWGLDEAVRLAVERYVEDEPHPELRRLAEVVAYARRQALLQQQLDDDRERLHHGHLNHEQLVETGHHYEAVRYEACKYNHWLRNLIETCGHYCSRDDLMGWLVTGSQGRVEWAKGELTGALSEVALHAALQGLPELRGLRYATLEEDLAGYDFVAEWQGNRLTIDAKTGFYRPLMERKHGHRHLEISVPREVVKDLRVTRHGLDLLRREARQALYQGDQPYHHAPHHYHHYRFRAASA